MLQAAAPKHDSSQGQAPTVGPTQQPMALQRGKGRGCRGSGCSLGGLHCVCMLGCNAEGRVSAVSALQEALSSHAACPAGPPALWFGMASLASPPSSATSARQSAWGEPPSERVNSVISRHFRLHAIPLYGLVVCSCRAPLLLLSCLTLVLLTLQERRSTPAADAGGAPP